MVVVRSSGPPAPSGSRADSRGGFTLVEILAVVAIVAALTSLGVSRYGDFVTNSRVSKAVTEILALQARVDDYSMTYGELPPSLAAAGAGNAIDPWGNPYEYLPFGEDVPKGARRDAFLVPINTSFDLYSRGADGKTQQALTARVSHDDVVRANDGTFVGLASEY